MARQHADTLEQTIATIRQKIVSMENAENRRLEEAERRKRFFEENDLSDTENQLRFINQADLRAVNPVNKEAARVVLFVLEEWIRTRQGRWRLSFEVAMGAFIKTHFDPEDRTQKAAFSSYNSKRVDFLLIDQSGRPKLAIEYHGTGHGQSNDTESRMDVKRLALSRAGIPLIEIPANTPKTRILHLLDKTLLEDSSPAMLG